MAVFVPIMDSLKLILKLYYKSYLNINQNLWSTYFLNNEGGTGSAKRVYEFKLGEIIALAFYEGNG